MEALLLPGLLCPIWLWLQCLSDHFASLAPNMFKVPGRIGRFGGWPAVWVRELQRKRKMTSHETSGATKIQEVFTVLVDKWLALLDSQGQEYNVPSYNNNNNNNSNNNNSYYYCYYSFILKEMNS